MTSKQIESVVAHCNFNREVAQIKKLTGGDINDVFRISWNGLSSFVVKINEKEQFPEMFAKEAHNLNALIETATFRVPSPISYFEDNKYQYLLLDDIKTGKKDNLFFIEFAQSLAQLHKYTNLTFGWEEDNYIGSLVQKNSNYTSWQEFYAENRINTMVKIAYDKGYLTQTLLKKIKHFNSKISDIFPTEQPALLHGDLWNGNFMIDESGNPTLIDPACYFGHREMDLGMTDLFGGFDAKFIEHYHVFYPLEKGWEQRLKYTQLYPLLVHLNLFGQEFLPDIERTLSQF